MVDVSAKPIVSRRAVAQSLFKARESTIDLLLGVAEGEQLPKGDALATARIAGIQGAKRCDELIPLCQSLPLDHVSVDFERQDATTIRITGSASTTARTGVEMEAILAVSIAAVTLYDMAKSVDRDLAIEQVRLISKEKSESQH